MKKERTIAATFLALAAVVGFSMQSGTKTEDTSKTDRTGLVIRSKPALKNLAKNLPGCGSLQSELQDFLETTTFPNPCSENGNTSDTESPSPNSELVRKTSQLKFVIAVLPDPVHTHLPVLFDQFAVAIQEGAQDENYDFDSSWLPWDEEETPYESLADEKASNSEKERKENQPGIILFRRALDCPQIGASVSSRPRSRRCTKIFR
jgi:hypothetical protein